ncbi:class I SAM-dependent methyltransferase [Corynebacterium sp. sy017]|uniref:class I SAM-dependent methyltransferase n=1 Tax=unclassified Corynebacterium TaxID=2624378 RepID=UPI001186714F|nr:MULTISPECIES: class I SAM-dependent methyltransferase [unclassified Corynebacterium]MBP3089342.1 class I SAM-dependent methyltransferase [Corynebacterium sp. sy017]QDZ43277.1 class I SAM-dependent methyltransferase [Corynebacterium sp. sy039]TSD90960.1 class I SAM-dependent methyltransferase [Corynebacterium sp. SY003]
MANHAHNMRADFSATHPGRGFMHSTHPTRPVGVITRGTTAINRLRRCDRWAAHNPTIRYALTHTDSALALDVGYGASYHTTVEWARWLRTIRQDVRVIGLEIDPNRIQEPRYGVSFELGGFELAGYRPTLVRAFNVLRQYDVADVEQSWRMVCERLAPGGLFIEGTCDELGRRSTWILLDKTGPQSLTLAWDPHDMDKPSDIAERLPKILIQRNVVGEKIYDLLQLCDQAWQHCAPWSIYGPRVRWHKTRELLRQQGLEFTPIRRRVRDNQITFSWSQVCP